VIAIGALTTSSVQVAMPTPSTGGTLPYVLNLYRSTTPGFSVSGSPLAADVDFPYVDNSSIVPGTTYYYRVRTVDDDNNTADSNQVSALVPTTTTVYAIPVAQGIPNPPYFNLMLRQGSTVVSRLILKDDDGGVIDLTGWTARMMVRSTYTSTTTLVDLTQDADDQGQIELGGESGVLTIRIYSTHTTGLTPGKAVYDLELVNPIGEVTRVLEGEVLITPEVTR
jgi:hypothetical protein